MKVNKILVYTSNIEKTNRMIIIIMILMS